MPRRRRRFLFPLDAGGVVYIRARLDTEAGQVVGFAIQLEVLVEGAPQIVIRFDTSHGYVHQHIFDSEGRERRERLRFASWAEAYTYSYEYVKRNWRTLTEPWADEL